MRHAFKRIAVLFAAMLLCTACGDKKEEEKNEIPEETASAYAGFRSTVLYYGTDDGFIVPVMRRIPWEEGIGKAALQYLVNEDENRLAIAPYGLRALIPEGTDFELRIGDDRCARVDLSGFPGDANAQELQEALTAVVNTLTEFESIDSVEVFADGKPLGDESEAAHSQLALNAVEDAVSVSTGQNYPMVLYFPNASASLNVPVTKYNAQAPDFYNAVCALISGPENEGLMNCFPEGTAVYRADIENGVATVDLSSDYLQVKETEGLLNAGYHSLFLTAQCFAPTDRLNLTVNGGAIEELPTFAPLYANELTE